MAPFGRFIAVNHATNMQVLIRLLFELSLVGLKELGRESNCEASPRIAIFGPLLRVIAVTAQARHVELEGVCERIIVEQIVETSAEMVPEEIIAYSDFTDDPPCDPEGISEFGFVPLVQVAKTPQLLVAENAFERHLASVVIQRLRGRALDLLHE